MITKIGLFAAGYFIMLLTLYFIATSDKYAPSMFGKWTLIFTPIYLVVFFILNYIFKKKKNEKAN